MNTTKLVVNPTLNGSIHCIVFVVNATAATNEDEYKCFMNFRLEAQKKNIPFMVVITQGDCKQGCEYIKGSPLKIYESFKLQKIREEVAGRTGVLLGNILLVKNYQAEMFPSEEVNLLNLFAMNKIIGACDDYYSKLLNGTATHEELK